jgi:hypothetical protein
MVLNAEDVMRNDRSYLTPRLTPRSRWMRPAALALGLASAAAMAHAQAVTPPAPAEKAGPPAAAAGSAAAAAAANPSPVQGVTVNGRRPDTGAPIPDDKKAAYDAEAAREAAFRDYRASRPPLNPDAKGVVDPNDQSKDFPGLQSYLPK